jgi:hypothetical protein
MARNGKVRPASKEPPASTFLSLLSGWVQQGVESFFATQRVLIDVAMRQNAIAMKGLRESLADPEHSPVALVTELAVEGTSSFIEAQRILLNLAQQESELVTGAIKERVGGSKPAVAMTDLVRRSVETFVGMQEEFLKITSQQTIRWLDAIKAGKYFESSHAVEFARQGMDNFVDAQKKFLDIVADETAKATGGKPQPPSKAKKTELSKLAREATDAFIEAQKRLLDVVGQQMSVNLKTATRMVETVSPARLLPMANFTGAGVKSFVEAEKTLLDAVVKPRHSAKAPKRRARQRAAMAATA